MKPYEWRAVVGFEGFYEVSNRGEVRRVAPARGTSSGYIQKGTIDRKTGYCCVVLHRNGRAKVTRAHRVVAEAFLGPRPYGKTDINHIDGDKSNNAADNLEYLTRAENNQHAMVLGLARMSRQRRLYEIVLAHSESCSHCMEMLAKVGLLELERAG